MPDQWLQAERLPQAFCNASFIYYRSLLLLSLCVEAASNCDKPAQNLVTPVSVCKHAFNIAEEATVAAEKAHLYDIERTSETIP
jgi:hypothetical protein